MSGNTAGLMSDFLFGGRKRVPQQPLPIINPVPTLSAKGRTGLRVTWLGHSSMLIESDGIRVLTDPVFGQHAAPVSFVGRQRFHPVPATLDELQPIDAVLLSHDHYDHLCTATIRKIAALGLPVITSLGVGARIEKLGVSPRLITELDWWEQHDVAGKDMSITATPAQHFSGRGLRDRNATLWSSWVIKTSNKTIFFSGDTGLTADLALIGQRHGPFDIAMLEIGASNPAWAHIHLGPQNALRAFEMLGGGTLLPIHWGTFDLALHSWEEPAETLLTLANDSGARVLTPMLGQPIEPELVSDADPWWREVTTRL